MLLAIHIDHRREIKTRRNSTYRQNRRQNSGVCGSEFVPQLSLILCVVRVQLGMTTFGWQADTPVAQSEAFREGRGIKQPTATGGQSECVQFPIPAFAAIYAMEDDCQMSSNNDSRSIISWFSSILMAAGLAVAVATGAGVAAAQTASKPLSANDVSILFPPPKTAADMANLIAVSDLVGPTGSSPQRLWSDDDFAHFLANAENPERSGTPDSGVHKIGLPDSVKNIAAWFVAGIRIDAGAPGLSNEIIAQFGRQPQVRLIIQPITNGPEGFKVHDIAGHLIFSFGLDPDRPLDGCAPFPRSKPDDETFKVVIRDVAALRDQLAAGSFGGVKVVTTGDLNVHPGLLGASAKPFRDALKALLEKHLSSQRLNTMAVMGIDAPEPWIFVSMLKVPGAGFISVPGPTLDGVHVAQMFSIFGGKHVVRSRRRTIKTRLPAVTPRCRIRPCRPPTARAFRLPRSSTPMLPIAASLRSSTSLLIRSRATSSIPTA
jgi:hypothetical protein